MKLLKLHSLYAILWSKRPSSRLSLHKVPRLRRSIQIKDATVKLRPGQTSLYVSAECPVWSRFLQLECDFGISHDYLPGFDSHCRVPYWYYSIDWNGFDIANNSSRRILIRQKAPTAPLLRLYWYASTKRDGHESDPDSARTFAAPVH